MARPSKYTTAAEIREDDRLRAQRGRRARGVQPAQRKPVPSNAKYPVWAYLIRTLTRPAVIGRGRWASWYRGAGRPAITTIDTVANALGLTESAVIFFSGHDTAAATGVELRALHANRVATIARARFKARYASDPEFRRAQLDYTAARVKAHRAANPAPWTVHKRTLDALSPDERREHRLALHRANGRKNGHRQRLRAKARRSSEVVARIAARQVAREEARIARRVAAQQRRAEKLSKTTHGQRGYASRREWIAADPAGFREWELAYWKARTHLRDARKAELPGSWDSNDWFAQLDRYGSRCAYCGISRAAARRPKGFDLEADHILDIWDEASRNDVSNLATACKPCNSSKSDHDLLKWLARKKYKAHPVALIRYAALKGIADVDSILGRFGSPHWQGHPPGIPLAEDRGGPAGAGPRSVEALA